MTYNRYPDGDLLASAKNCAVVATSDGNDQPRVCKAFRASIDGQIRLTPENLDDGSYVDHPVLAGERVDLQVKRFWTTGTTGGMGIMAYFD